MNWTQLNAVFWLRSRLTKNQWSRGGRLNAVLMVLAIIFGIALTLGGCVAGFVGGAFSLAKSRPDTLLLVWDVIAGSFLFIWLAGVLTEIQRSEAIDLTRLLHLPVSLRWIFVMNYLGSHLTLGILVFVPAMLGVCAGLVWGKGLIMILLAPLALSFVFTVTAWTYCLRGWLISLMVNPRKRRSIVMIVTLSIVLLGQLPNFYFNVFRSREGTLIRSRKVAETAIPAGFREAHKYVPPLWVAKGAVELAAGNPWPALAAFLAGICIGAGGLAWAYRSTMQFYQGEEKSRPVRKAQASENGRPLSKSFLEKTVPLLPAEVTALSLALFRSMTRAPEIKMALITNFVVILVFVGMFFKRQQGWMSSEAMKPFVATGAVGFTFFGMLQLQFNQFGFDRDGFRALILLPVQRRNTLWAKNIAIAPIPLGLGTLLLLLIKLVANLPWLIFMAGCLQLLAAFCLLSTFGNFVSVMAPYRIAAGSLKPTKASGITALLIFTSHLLLPLAMIPIFAPAGLGLVSHLFKGWSATGVNGLGSLILLTVTGILYWISLPALGNLLQRREMKILQIVSQEIE